MELNHFEYSYIRLNVKHNGHTTLYELLKEATELSLKSNCSVVFNWKNKDYEIDINKIISNMLL